jgi:hypothetical protein
VLCTTASDSSSAVKGLNSKKTFFMKCNGDEYVTHALFVDDRMHTYSCDAMED